MMRNEILERIQSEEKWDVIVIGGGATGLGTAVDAASRGFKTLLLEAYDFAKGTSSRSTKLVHGGVRYLAQGNLSLVYEALHERGRLQRNAPHLVKPLSFVVPGYKWWNMPWYGSGLVLYSLMAGKLGFGISRPITKKEALKLAPTLEPKGLMGGIIYYDGQFDDTRLAIALMRTVEDKGGVAINYMRVTELPKINGMVDGVVVQDTIGGKEYRLRAKAIINATGVFVDQVRQLDEPGSSKIISPSQGIHFVLDKSFLPGDHAIMIPKTDDGRVLFAVPWHNRVILGTTDTPVKEIKLEPRPMHEEIQYLLSHAARYLSKDPTPADVLSVYTGLRPLMKGEAGDSTASLSREHTLLVSPSGLITITGGKWTTYRKMGEVTVDKAIAVGGLPQVACVTQDLPIHGWKKEPQPEPFGVYGSDAAALKELLAEQPGWEKPLNPNLPYLAGEVVWAARYEQARTVEDFLARRTRALLLDARASQEMAPKVAELLAAELGFDAAWQTEQVRFYRELADGYLLQPAKPEAAPVTAG
jgi:glycerol-3-phosphate dehydrogenase